MTTISPLLALTCGDPAGCGPQITGNAWQALREQSTACFFVIGAPELYRGVPVEVIASPDDAPAVFARALPVLTIDMPTVQPGIANDAAAPATIEAIRMATQFALDGRIGGIVTNPINKAQFYAAGFSYPGHTEYLAALCAEDGVPPQPVMMLVGGGLKVALATIHMPLKDVPGALSIEHLKRIARITHTALKRDFGFASPRLAFSGLNPHAGENGTLGREEIDIINPAAKALRKEGINIPDARSGDTVFAEALSGAYDGVIAMTHDQGLIPVKTLDLWGGVNVTLGLPIIRTSPDHGTAYDAAARGDCKPDSLIAAIHLANVMAGHHARVPA